MQKKIDCHLCEYYQADTMSCVKYNEKLRMMFDAARQKFTKVVVPCNKCIIELLLSD